MVLLPFSGDMVEDNSSGSEKMAQLRIEIPNSEGWRGWLAG